MSHQTGHPMKIMQKLTLAASHYAESNPELSRFFIYQKEMLRPKIGLSADEDHLTCPYCGSIYRPGNHQVTVVSEEDQPEKDPVVNEATKAKAERMFKLPKKAKKNRLEIYCKICIHTETIPYDGAEDKVMAESPEGNAELHLSYKARRKLRKRQLRQKNSQVDSGIEISHTGSLFSTAASLDSLNSTTFSSEATPKFTSTPILKARSSVLAKPVKKPLFDSASQISVKKSRKKGNTCNTLQHMLAQQKKVEAKSSGIGTLQQFLSGV